jgi:hypothetical protein
MLRRPAGGSGYGFARSIASLIPTQNLRHSLAAPKMLRIFLFGPPNRYIQPERYAQYVFEFFAKFYENIIKTIA